MSTLFLTFFYFSESMYRRSPAESGHLLYYPHFPDICQDGSIFPKMFVVCKIYLDRGSYRSAAGEFTYKCIPTKKNKMKKVKG